MKWGTHSLERWLAESVVVEVVYAVSGRTGRNGEGGDIRNGVQAEGHRVVH